MNISYETTIFKFDWVIRNFLKPERTEAIQKSHPADLRRADCYREEKTRVQLLEVDVWYCCMCAITGSGPGSMAGDKSYVLLNKRRDTEAHLGIIQMISATLLFIIHIHISNMSIFT